MANEEDLMNQEEVGGGGEEETTNENTPPAGRSMPQPSKRKVTGSIEGALEKKVKKQLLIGFLGSACACCLPIVAFMLSLSFLTIIAAYLKGLIN